MDRKDVEVIEGIHNSLQNTKPEAFQIANPAQEVENSLVDFLKHRLTKLKDDVTFEDNVKTAVLARIAEATFPQLTSLLEILQRNSNVGMEKVLAPFIASSGEKTILDSTKEMDRTSKKAEEVFDETNDKDILQSLTMLNQLMELANKEKSSTNNEE